LIIFIVPALLALETDDLSQQPSPTTWCRLVGSKRTQNQNAMIAMAQSLYQYRVFYIVSISFWLFRSVSSRGKILTLLPRKHKYNHNRRQIFNT